MKILIGTIFICFILVGLAFGQKGEVSADTDGEQTQNLPLPVYPETARKIGLQGNVAVRVNVDAHGNVTSAEALGLHPICPSVITSEILEIQKVSVEAAKKTKFALSDTDRTRFIRYAFLLVEKDQNEKDQKKVKLRVVGEAAQIAGPENSSTDGVLNGKATSLPKPSNPAAAKVLKAGGKVEVQILISEDGSVYSAEAISGHPLLRASSEIAACNARFSPIFLDGKPVKVLGVITYNYGK